MLDLYYYPSNASLAPHLLLAETNAEYSLKLVDRDQNAQKSKEYLKLNPAGRIPTLVHNDLVLFESAAICIHICELDDSSAFIPPVGLHFFPHGLPLRVSCSFWPSSHPTPKTSPEALLCS